MKKILEKIIGSTITLIYMLLTILYIVALTCSIYNIIMIGVNYDTVKDLVISLTVCVVIMINEISVYNKLKKRKK